MPRAIVFSRRMPEFDRERGSQRVLEVITLLQEDGWSVCFVAQNGDGGDRYAALLRDRGVLVMQGDGPDVETLLATGGFSLAVIAFWEVAEQYLPLLRRCSPSTRVLIDMIDLHFLRNARRLAVASARAYPDGPFDAAFGDELAREMNTYAAADGVLAVSATEATLVDDLLGRSRGSYVVPLCEEVPLSTTPFADRRGVMFVGNFRHLPNGEAVEFLCSEVLPRLHPDLLREHPVHVIGHAMPESVRSLGAAVPGVQMVGWVPSLTPYFESCRVSVVPLLHGAGQKGKLLQALMAGLPSVSTSVGAESLDLVPDRHFLLADDAAGFAEALERLLTDGALWADVATNAREHVASSFSRDATRDALLAAVEDVLAARRAPARVSEASRRRHQEYVDMVAGVQEAVAAVAADGDAALVVAKGDPELAALGVPTTFFPQAADGSWAGHHPATDDEAIRHLEALRQRGATLLVVPSSSLWWLHHYAGFRTHLESNYRVAWRGAAGVVYRLTSAPPAVAAANFLCVSSLDDVAAEALVAADALVLVTPGVEVPAGTVERLVAVQRELGWSVAQASLTIASDIHRPITERHLGAMARETAIVALEGVVAIDPAAVDAVRAGRVAGAVGIVDEVAVTVGSASATAAPAVIAGDAPDEDAASRVLAVWRRTPDGLAATHARRPDDTPELSVVVATYDRAELLRECLESFVDQTAPASSYELVVVDDGSADDTGAVAASFRGRVPITYLRIDHAGRSAAKNIGILAASAPVVLLFDDDDVATADLVERHVAAHRREPGLATAVLGRTTWDPNLRVTPIMEHVTDVDQVLFAYHNIRDGQVLDYRHFWEGRISCKRALLTRHGLHDQRLAYTIDIELGYRLARHGLRVVYDEGALSYMRRPITFEQFCRRCEAKGEAQATFAALHPVDEIRTYCHVDGAAERWRKVAPEIDSVHRRVAELEAELEAGGDDDARRTELFQLYRKAFTAARAKGIAAGVAAAPSGSAPSTAAPSLAPDPARPVVATRPGGSAPATLAAAGHAVGNGSVRPATAGRLSVIVPAWNVTPELAAMTERNLARVWEVQAPGLDVELVLVDNGSTYKAEVDVTTFLPFPTNRGISTAWNAGADLATGDVLCFFNTDVEVAPGWDAALYGAARAGRRVAFPYTDHGDGLGPRQPDTGGTAGWCFALSREVWDEVGRFDEGFNPAFFEDTDYFHRAWDLGVDLNPVPAAAVRHVRRSSASKHARMDWLFQAHRHKYGWKHGVDPTAPPPFYLREIVEYGPPAPVAALAGSGRVDELVRSE